MATTAFTLSALTAAQRSNGEEFSVSSEMTVNEGVTPYFNYYGKDTVALAIEYSPPGVEGTFKTSVYPLESIRDTYRGSTHHGIPLPQLPVGTTFKFLGSVINGGYASISVEH